MIRQLILLAIGLAGAALLSQAPAFVAQYKQNLSGRLAILNGQVREFENKARAAGRTPQQEVQELRDKGGASRRQGNFVQDRLYERDRLRKQKAEIDAAGPFVRVWALVKGYDQAIAEDAYKEFEPAIPTTVEGAGHAAAGFFLFRIIGYFFAQAFAAIGAIFGFGRSKHA